MKNNYATNSSIFFFLLVIPLSVFAFDSLQRERIKTRIEALEKKNRTVYTIKLKDSSAIKLQNKMVELNPNIGSDDEDRYPEKLLDELENYNENDYDSITWNIIIYRKGELYYKVKKYKKAKRMFKEYIKRCKNKSELNCDLLNYAEEYLEILKAL